MYTLSPYLEEYPIRLLYILRFLSLDKIDDWISEYADIYCTEEGYKIQVYNTQQTIEVKTMREVCEIVKLLNMVIEE